MSGYWGVDAGPPLPSTMRTIKDPVHDLITFPPLIWAIIDTRQFQRLRSIKQLGVSYFVWAGASHNRFEHCLGVAHLAGMLVERLKERQPELGITDRDILCVTIAGLCHDLGHGPWSHVWDGLFIPAVLPLERWTHEDASEMMFDDLVEQNGVQIVQDDINFIKDLIKGEMRHSSHKCPPEKRFLFDIVANKRNGIDVDKFDYLARDIRAIGDHNNFSARRLIESARVINDEICYNIKDANQIYELFYLRFSNHKRIYSHKTARAIEYMIIDALKEAEPKMKIAEQIKDPKRYVFLTDDIMARIESSEDPDLAESRAIFDRIRTRDLYKTVDWKTFPWAMKDRLREAFTPDRIVRAAKTFFEDHDSDSDAERPSQEVLDSLSEGHVIIDQASLHYGMKDKNPIDSVRFYGKHQPDVAFNAQEGDFSTLMPSVFGEVLLRIYTKEDRYYAVIQKGYGEILKTLALDDDGDFRQPPLTPPTTEAPSTPRALSAQPSSRNTSFSSVATLGGPDPASPEFPQTTKKGTPFANNRFAQVPSTFVPASPAQKHRRPRQRTESDGSIGTPKASQTGEPFSASASASGAGSITILQRQPSPSPVRKSNEPSKLGLSGPKHTSNLQASPSVHRTRSLRRRRDEESDVEPDATISKKKRI